jgi:hypothetical protein
LKRWTDDLRKSDQIANIYRSDVEQAKVLLDLLRWMGERDQMVFLTDRWERQVFRHAILDAAIEENRLIVLPSRSTMCASGRFDPKAFLHFLAGEISRSIDEGYRHLVLMWEADWAAASREWSTQVAKFGSLLALARIPGGPTIIAQYGAGYWGEEWLASLRRSNQLVLEGGALTRNFWVVSTSSLRAMTATPAEPQADKVQIDETDHRPG